MPVQSSLFESAPDPSGPLSTTPPDARLIAARLQGLLRELSLLNEEFPVIVEGRHDIDALRRLGLKGAIVTLHCGRTVAAFAEQLSRRFPAVILLLDWDRRGRQLHTQLTRHLETDWEEYHYIRQELITLCKFTISSVEELPALLAAPAHPAEPAPPRKMTTAGRHPTP
jgi:5S rRNA maturation endonuclease (ribonuclease M5)